MSEYYHPAVTKAFTGALRRQPTQAELYSYAALLESSAITLNQIISNLINSAECVNVVHPIVRLFRAAYNRYPDDAGLDYWAQNHRQQGAASGASTSTLLIAAQTFASPNTPEFVQVYGIDPPNEDFVRQVYNVCMQRPIDNAGLQYWTGLLDNGMSRGEVLANFVMSAEMINTHAVSVTSYLTQESM